MSTYSQLQKFIPPDQALANKAVEASLQQIKGIFNSILPDLAIAVAGLESNKGLPLINAMTEPLPPDVVGFYDAIYANGTGTDGTLLLADIMGTPSGWIHNAALANAISVLNTMTAAGTFSILSNETNGVYTIMQNCNDGDYTTIVTEVPYVISITIPGGLPGAGTYSSYDDAFKFGLIPAAEAAISTIVANNAAAVAQTTAGWNSICAQLVRETANLSLVPIVFDTVIGNIPPQTLVNNLPQYGLDTSSGGAAYMLEALATTSTRGGQAVISTMREARNLARLSAAGIETDIYVSDAGTETPATLTSGDYTVDQAIQNIII